MEKLNKKYKLAVIGSRTITDKKIVFNYLDSKYDKIEMIISGGASGPDEFGRQWAQDNGLPCLIHYAKWRDKEGFPNKGAGYARNHNIIKDCDICVCFYDGQSKGSKHSMDLCKEYGKKLIVIDCKSE